MENTEKNPVVIEAAQLTKYYANGQTKALNGVDLTIRQGDFLAVMGASGSGKSTLLHLLAGLTRPTSGTVQLAGAELASLSDSALTRLRRRQVGLVFQHFNLIPQLSALENILLPALAEGISRREAKERAEKLAETLDLTQQLRQRPDTLSGGERQRVTLARALSMNPAILLADEPTGNLDTLASRQISEIFDRLCREEGRTILLVTHEPAAAVWSKRLIILSDGRIIADRKTAEFGDFAGLAAGYQKIVESNREKFIRR